MSAYLFCARISELVSHKSPTTKTDIRGPKGNDAHREIFKIASLEEEVAVFRIATTHGQKGKPRLIGLPMNVQYEPWTKEVIEYFEQKKDKPVFPFSRQKVWNYSKSIFKGLRYPIETYSVREDEISKTVDRHMKPFRIHALRHLRASELIEVYGFDGVDLSIYGGWTLKSMIGVGSAMERYVHLQWRRYFPKLLKRRI